MLASAREVFQWPPRNELIAAAFFVGLANGLTENIHQKIIEQGALFSIADTFGISAIVWISAYLAISFCLKGRREPASPGDIAVIGLALAAFFVPSSKFNWIALTALMVYALRWSDDIWLRKGALIGAAVTFPMFWSKVIFSVLSGWILQADAILVSLLLGFKRVGNTIELPDGTELWIASGCSSMANISLTVLCWTAFLQTSETPRDSRAILICFLACVAVVIINVGRMSLMGLKPDWYDFVHGPVGASVAGWLTTGAIVGICAFGLKHEAFARR